MPLDMINEDQIDANILPPVFVSRPAMRDYRYFRACSLASHARRALILSMRGMAGVCNETNRQKSRHFKKVRGANEYCIAFGGALQSTLREFRRMSRDVREIG